MAQPLTMRNWLGQILSIPVYESEDISELKLKEFADRHRRNICYVGSMLMSGWLHKHDAILRTKSVYVFVVCGTPACNTGECKKLVDANIPADLVQANNVSFLPGRMTERDLLLKERFVLQMGACCKGITVTASGCLRIIIV